MALTFAEVAVAQNISIATGGVYYLMDVGLAAVPSKYVPGMQATAEVTGGLVNNLSLIGTDKPHIGFTMADSGPDAYKDEDKFKGNKDPLRTLYPNHMHLLMVEVRGINKVVNLKGKHIPVDSPGSATEVMSFRIFKAAGLDKDKDVKRERLSVAESVNAMNDKKIDAFFWLGGLPTAAINDLANMPSNSSHLHHSVTTEILDAAVIVEPQLNLYKASKWSVPVEEPLCVMTPTSMAERNPPGLLATEPFISFDRAICGGRQADHYLLEQQIRPRDRVELDALSAIAVLVHQGLVASPLPNWTLPWPYGLQIVRQTLPTPVPVRRMGWV